MRALSIYTCQDRHSQSNLEWINYLWFDGNNNDMYTLYKHWSQSVHHHVYYLNNPFGKKSLQSLFLHLFNASSSEHVPYCGNKRNGVRCQVSVVRVHGRWRQSTDAQRTQPPRRNQQQVCSRYGNWERLPGDQQAVDQ